MATHTGFSFTIGGVGSGLWIVLALLLGIHPLVIAAVAPVAFAFFTSAAYLVVLWIRSRPCVAYLGGVMYRMIPGRRDLAKESLADRPPSIRAIRVLNQVSELAFNGLSTQGPMAALGYSDFVVGPSWFLEYETQIAEPTVRGISRIARAGIAALAARQAGSDLMYVWHRARFIYLNNTESHDDRSHLDASDLLTLITEALSPNHSHDAPLCELLRPVLHSRHPAAKAHIAACMTSALFSSRIARCFCDWPWGRWSIPGLLHRFVFEHINAPMSLHGNLFEGASFTSVDPTDSSFRASDRDAERSEEELPEHVQILLSNQPAMFRAVSAWYRTMVRCGRSALRKESRDLLTKSVFALPGHQNDVRALADVAQTTPHPADRGTLLLSLVTAVDPVLIRRVMVVSALHEKGALGTIHAVCFGAAVGVLRNLLQLLV